MVKIFELFFFVKARNEVDSGDPDLSKDENDEDLLMLSFGSGYHFSSGPKRSQ